MEFELLVSGQKSPRFKRKDNMMLKTVKLITSIFLSSMLFGCFPLAAHLVTPTMSSGLYTKIDSTAPGFGPVHVGLTRAYAERYLGQSLFVMDLDENHYVNVYRYERERDVKDTIVTDLLDVVTFGLGVYMVSPIDRFNGTFHLMAVTYRIEDKNGTGDRIVGITDRLTNSPLAILWVERSKNFLLKSEWDQGIESASIAIALDAKIGSAYVNRAWAFVEKGQYDAAIRDCNVALALDSDNTTAYNNRGLAYQKKGNVEGAAKDFKKACERGLAVACENLGLVTVKK